MYDLPIENKKELAKALKTLNVKIVNAFEWKTDNAPGIVPGSRGLDLSEMIEDFTRIIENANDNMK